MRQAARMTALALLVPLLPAAIAACGDDGTGPEAGEVQMTVQDDPTTTQAALVHDAFMRAVTADPSLVVGGREALARARSPRDAAARAPAGTFHGSITAEASGYVSSDGSTWVEVGSPTSATVELQSDDATTVHASSTVHGGSYSHVRLVLRGARATLMAGSVVGGLTLDSDLTLTLGGSDAEVVIEKQVSTFEVRSDARTTIVWEMNSEEWSNEENAEDEEVEDAEVQQASEAEARSESSARTAGAGAPAAGIAG